MNIIFFDIDGTLARGTEVPLSAQKSIRQLRNNGDLIFICTGRPYKYAYKNFYMYANGFICFNGRYAHMGCCEVLADHPAEKEKIEKIIQILDEQNAGYTFFTSDAGYFGGNEEGYSYLTHGWDKGFIHRDESFDHSSVYSFDVYFKDTEHRQRIEKALEGVCLLNPHGPHPTADVTILGNDKGTAIQEVAERLHVPIENTYAFGDGMNDICMFTSAGHSIAMGNALDEVKKHAEYITDDIDQDGVMKGLQHFHLI